MCVAGERDREKCRDETVRCQRLGKRWETDAAVVGSEKIRSQNLGERESGNQSGDGITAGRDWHHRFI